MLCTVRMISVEAATEVPPAGVCLVTFHWLSCCTADPSSATNVIFEKPAPLRVVSATSPVLFVTSGTAIRGGAALVGGALLGGGLLGGGALLVLVLAEVGGVTAEFEVVGPPVTGVPLSRLKM